MKSRLKLIPLCIFIIVNFICADLSQALEAPERETQAQGDIDPFSVVLYREPAYKQPFATFRLQVGKRMLKIPKLAHFPGSALLGSKVGALLFYDPNYSSSYLRVNKKTITGTPLNYWLLTFDRIMYTTPQIFKGHINTGSLIIHRKDIGDFLGVLHHNQFYALPENAKDTHIIYHKIAPVALSQKPFQELPPCLSIVPGGTGVTSWPNGHPRVTDIRVTVTGQYGVRKLPQGNNAKYPLKDLHVGLLSSIEMEYLGPYNETVYLPAQAHRAPPAPVKIAQKDLHYIPEGMAKVPGQSNMQIKENFIPEIAGEWKSSINRIYHIDQRGNEFEWGVEHVEERGRGIIEGHLLHAAWESPRGKGKADGTIIDFDGNRRAVRIKWNNGVVFFR